MSDGPPNVTLSFHESIADIPPHEWNALLGTAPAFMSHEFISALERCNLVTPEQGWLGCHLALRDENNQLKGAVPLYEKHHSWGEFVFDWAWADAYQRAGLSYYPKLVAAAPFTPASSPRLLIGPEPDQSLQIALLKAIQARAENRQLSSAHVQFLDETELEASRQTGMLLRKDCQFHWHNNAYNDFDAFLAQFSSAKRKKVKRERRRIREAGIRFVHLSGNEMTESDWRDAFELTRITFQLRGREPYLNLNFFLTLVEQRPEFFRVIFAQHDQRRIAAAICFVSADALYGRYWGADAAYHSLHFETCYYQGIEFCIDSGLQRFEPGTQGEHKVSRGFLPQTTWSAHWLSNPQFASAIENHLGREQQYIDAYMREVGDHSPFRNRGDHS